MRKAVSVFLFLPTCACLAARFHSNTLTWQHWGDSSKGIELQSTDRIAGVQHFHHQEDEADEQEADVQHLWPQWQPQDSCQESETPHISTKWLLQGRILLLPNLILKGSLLERREVGKITSPQPISKDAERHRVSWKIAWLILQKLRGPKTAALYKPVIFVSSKVKPWGISCLSSYIHHSLCCLHGERAHSCRAYQWDLSHTTALSPAHCVAGIEENEKRHSVMLGSGRAHDSLKKKY